MKSPRPAYWRVIALDWFTDDNAWGVNKATEQQRVDAHRRPSILPPSKPLHQQFTIEQIDPHWLPAAYRPVSINLLAARVVPDSLTLLVDSTQPVADLIYDVQSDVPDPSQRAARTPLDSTPTPSRKTSSSRRLPRLGTHARGRSITQNATGPYEKAVALEDVLPQARQRSPTRSTRTSTTRATRSVQFLQQRRGLLRAVRGDVRGDGPLASASRRVSRSATARARSAPTTSTT